MPVNKINRSDGTTVDKDLQEAEQADITAKARRVILTDSDGTSFSTANPLPVDTELAFNGNLIIDNINVFATDISDGDTASFFS